MASVLNTGAARDPRLQNVLWEIALIAARHQFVIKAKHIMGVSNRVPDWLSRWHQEEARQEFRKHVQDSGLRRIKVSSSLLSLDNVW